MVHRMVEAMSQLQEERARLQEELVALRERLAIRDSDLPATSTQLQNQVPGEDGMGRGHCPPWSRSEDVAPVTWNPPGHWHNGHMGSPLLARECSRVRIRGPDHPSWSSLCSIPHGYQRPRTYLSRVAGSTYRRK